MTITTTELIRSLQASVCPACGKHKRRAMSFCGPCFYRLPKPLRDALYLRVGKGYEQAMQDALVNLGVEQMNLPPDPSTRLESV